MEIHQTMETNIAKCFICDVECTAEDRFLGTNISRTLTMSMTAMLAKCLRTILDTENEYFCGDCISKIEEYDQVIQMSVQIENELYEMFRKKPVYLLDAEIITDQNAIDDALLESENLNVSKEATQGDVSIEELDESYELDDEMVVEYLEDYETQSEDADLMSEPNQMPAIVKEELNTSTDDKTNTGKKPPGRKAKNKKRNVKSGTNKKKTDKRKAEPPKAVETKLECQECQFTAATREELEEHRAFNHIDEIKRLACEICGRTYKSKSALCVHVGMHNGRNSHGEQ